MVQYGTTQCGQAEVVESSRKQRKQLGLFPFVAERTTCIFFQEKTYKEPPRQDSEGENREENRLKFARLSEFVKVF